MDLTMPTTPAYQLKAEGMYYRFVVDRVRQLMSPGSPLDITLEMLRGAAEEAAIRFKMLTWGREVCVEKGPTRTSSKLKMRGPFWIPLTLKDNVLAVGVDILRAANAVALRRLDRRAAKAVAKALRRWRRMHIRFAMRYASIRLVNTTTIEVHHKHFCPHVFDGRRDPHYAFLASGKPWHGSVDQYESMKKVVVECLEARRRHLETSPQYRHYSGDRLPYAVEKALRQYETAELLHGNCDYEKFLRGGEN